MRISGPFLTDPALLAVLDAIEAGGHRVFLVGGAVRNALLGEPIGDVDLSTDARPERVVELAQAAGLKPVPTGIEHGTITVVSGGTGFEVTTFRRDVETDGRRAIVAFSDSIEEDAERRDFTMNALYATRAGEVIDPVGGLDDLAARRLRFVGDPEERIHEDYLRILRFFRFHAWYGREAEPQALAACAALAGGLAGISKERIGAEMRKLLAAPDPSDALALMTETGILARVLPGADPAQMPALIAAEGDAAPAWPRRLALLGADDAADALRLSRAEAGEQAQLAGALAANWSLNEAGYRLGAALATDIALVRAARGLRLPEGWRDQIAAAARARLPIAAADLMPELQGPALGQGLKAAEARWIAEGFATPAANLIETARLAAKEGA
ncbi:CCA tRNA nucleotidyltransferase [Paracoccus zhejiangensis]|uniref:CCA tRNA nucleotidyltransferase n=1 Tax=Paracoccus zhejiangensis TaxID=1077935 RepID=A0A2H5EZ25_9RHOB|nr:CCA tRNA nucleotidyltransferase [Paracoccus zhejiangensis]AUH64533.1 CCA tRNA nucleotidyltransferase [Paracoccus zhejiangensis]